MIATTNGRLFIGSCSEKSCSVLSCSLLPFSFSDFSTAKFHWHIIYATNHPYNKSFKICDIIPKGETETHISTTNTSIQFLDNYPIQYFIFNLKISKQTIESQAKRSKVKGVSKQISPHTIRTDFFYDRHFRPTFDTIIKNAYRRENLTCGWKITCQVKRSCPGPVLWCGPLNKIQW